MAILAAGVGFAIRGGIFDNWGAEFGFTGAQLGAIGGAGFSGFCFGIIIGGVICDRIGYGKLVVLAFALHVLSAVVTFSASGNGAYQALYWGMFIFAFANGTLEAVANPLVATLFPHKRTHYLNILHASWPAGLIIGGALGWWLDDKLKWDWKWQLALYLIPTIIYGVMFLGQNFPKSEASEKGLSLGEMFKDVGVLGGAVTCFLITLFVTNALGMANASYAVGIGLLLVVVLLTHTHGSRGESIVPLGSFLLFFLFVAHALVGAVELGTDGWIQNITGNILSSEQGKILFVFTSALMFLLRFCADFIEKKMGLSPIGILVTCAILACVGLNLASNIQTFAGAFLALTVYAVGKTFFWPTMLAVASDRFPRTGAIAISIMGGIGMLSAGMIGSPGLGYAKDRFSGEALKASDPKLYDQYKAEKPSSFLFFADASGFDGKKFGEVSGKLAKERETIDKAKGDVSKAVEKLTPEEQKVHAASITGDRKTLVADSAIPALMALIYLGILVYFRSIGGYKAVHLEGTSGAGDKKS
ncbi:MAG: MFS transporter [Verrucomicrobia bacterium]|nr:MFS transporter [Verrucomicrobiota bacterium]